MKRGNSLTQHSNKGLRLGEGEEALNYTVVQTEPSTFQGGGENQTQPPALRGA